jgi:hypothetical protein
VAPRESDIAGCEVLTLRKLPAGVDDLDAAGVGGLDATGVVALELGADATLMTEEVRDTAGGFLVTCKKKKKNTRENQQQPLPSLRQDYIRPCLTGAVPFITIIGLRLFFFVFSFFNFKNLARVDKDAVVGLRREIGVAAHRAVVQADGLVKLHAAALALARVVVHAVEPQPARHLVCVAKFC